jgi:hypothetical protein
VRVITLPTQQSVRGRARAVRCFYRLLSVEADVSLVLTCQKTSTSALVACNSRCGETLFVSAQSPMLLAANQDRPANR